MLPLKLQKESGKAGQTISARIHEPSGEKPPSIASIRRDLYHRREVLANALASSAAADGDLRRPIPGDAADDARRPRRETGVYAIGDLVPGPALDSEDGRSHQRC
jgi:hypothetical protein